jgi:accessory gene regulator B
MLYQKLSCRIAEKLYASGHIKDAERDVYAYCMEIILSTAVDFCSIFLIACIFRRVLPTLFFLTGFFASRALCGGYHAKHHITCYLSTMADYAFFLLFDCIFRTASHKQAVVWCMLLFSFVMIFLFSPIDHPHNPMTQEQKQKGKRRNRIVLAIYAVAVVLLSVFLPIHAFLTAFVFGVFSTAAALFIAIIETKTSGGEQK